MQEDFMSTSMVFVIKGRRRLTVAHLVLVNTVVRVKKRSGDEFYVTTVLCVVEECDFKSAKLALLTVMDDSF